MSSLLRETPAKGLKILYLGDTIPSSNSQLRANSLTRLGHELRAIDIQKNPTNLLGTSLEARLHYHTGYTLLQKRIQGRLARALGHAEIKFDIGWVNGGELLGPTALKLIQKYCKKVVLYCNDDPTGTRDGNRWLTLKKAIPNYNLCVVVRDINMSEFMLARASKVIRVSMSYDEIMHAPPAIDEVPNHFHSEVIFVGTWMPERGPFILRLLERGIPICIRGGLWSKSPEWNRISGAWRGPPLFCRDYVKAVAGSKVCLGLLSKGNRDLHTRRSVEIPYIGGVLCAERTLEHQTMYCEGKDAIFWSSADECADACLALLNDDTKREEIRLNGMRRVRELKVGNDDICSRIVESAIDS